MPGVRKVYGPFHAQEVMGLIPAGNGSRTGTVGMDWHFFGVRDDHTMAAWTLRFIAATRKFQAHSTPIGEVGGREMRKIVPDIRKREVVNKEMFIGPTAAVETGKMADILRKRLKPEDIAKAQALAIIKR